jgi:lysyl-tRNA synthetase class 2
MPSSVIADIVYREERNELIVTFTTGKIYSYGLVPKRVYDEFRASRSKGNFFNSHVRDRYPARRMPQSPKA